MISFPFLGLQALPDLEPLLLWSPLLADLLRLDRWWEAQISGIFLLESGGGSPGLEIRPGFLDCCAVLPQAVLERCPERVPGFVNSALYAGGWGQTTGCQKLAIP